MASTRGRQVVLPLTNKSGGGVIAGDVVVIDTTNNDAFTTSTAGAVTIMVGVAQETIASNATGRVLVSGYAALVNVNASVTRGHYGKTHTVAKQATDAGASRVTGVFCVFLTGGTTPDAHLFAMPDGSSATGNVATDPIWDAAGDLAVGTGADTAAKLTKGSDNTLLVIDAATHIPAWSLSGSTFFHLYGPDNPAVSATTGTWIYNTGQWTDMGVTGPYDSWGWYNSSSAQNDALTYTLFMAAGTYAVTFRGRKSSNLGIITVYLDTVSQGTVDYYAASIAYAVLSVTGIVVAAGGSHAIQIKVATKNGSSSNYLMNLFDVIIRQTA